MMFPFPSFGLARCDLSEVVEKSIEPMFVSRFLNRHAHVRLTSDFWFYAMENIGV